MLRVFLPAMLLVAIGACASGYENRIRTSLTEAGLPRSMAGCMAERLVDQLSDSQLRSIARLAALRDRNVGAMRIDEFLRRARAAVDPEVYVVVTRAGLGCAIAG